MKARKRHRWTKEQKEFLKNNIEGRLTNDLLEMFNNHFNTNINIRQLRYFLSDHKLKSGVDTRFRKGHTPLNKGTRGVYGTGGNSGSFKAGQIPHNYKPVGSEITDGEGYTMIKVSDKGKSHERWKHKHRYLWEKEYGKIPDGHVIVFGDGDKTNCCLDNLLLLKREQLNVLVNLGLIQDDIRLTKAGISIADLRLKIIELEEEIS